MRDNVSKHIVAKLTAVIEERLAAIEAGEMNESEAFMPWERLWESGATWATKALPVDKDKNHPQQYAFGNGAMIMFFNQIHGFGDVRMIGSAAAAKLGGKLKAKYADFEAKEGNRKGDAGVMIWVPNMKTGTKEENGEKVKFRYCSSFSFNFVYNVQQFDWPNDELPKGLVEVAKRDLPNDPLEAAEEFIARHEIKIKEGVHASYMPMIDTIQMPGIRTFESSEAYYSVHFHEIGHWTGEGHRMNREGITAFFASKATYAYEELVAEFFQAIVCHHLGIRFERKEENSVSYLRGWLKALNDNPTWLQKAAMEADKAFQAYLTEWPEQKKAKEAKVA